jgi:hypothetical protein
MAAGAWRQGRKTSNDNYSRKDEYGHMAPELHEACFFENFEDDI